MVLVGKCAVGRSSRTEISLQWRFNPKTSDAKRSLRQNASVPKRACQNVWETSERDSKCIILSFINKRELPRQTVSWSYSNCLSCSWITDRFASIEWPIKRVFFFSFSVAFFIKNGKISRQSTKSTYDNVLERTFESKFENMNFKVGWYFFSSMGFFL